MGFSLLILTFFSLAAGFLRNELVLILLGAVFFAVALYSFAAVSIFILFHRRSVFSLSLRISPAELGPGQRGTILCSRNTTGTGGEGEPGRFFRLPGVLVRYLLELHTRDGRRLSHSFDPDRLKDNRSPFQAGERGAYYGDYDRLCAFDALGLFRVHFNLPREEGPRLLVLPGAAEEPVSVTVRAGGEERRTEPRFQRTDNLIDHRPYVPGDDPRKINWKLYSHAGDLFVRDGEPEPPPHSRLVILVDTQTDPALYSPEAGRRGVDILCEQVLSLVREYAGRGMEALIGYTDPAPKAFPGMTGEVPAEAPDPALTETPETGPEAAAASQSAAAPDNGLRGGTPGELAAVLACPAALPLSGPQVDLPAVPEDRGILVLALPRGDLRGEGALDRFLKTRGNKKEIDLLFLYNGEGPDAAAEEDVLFYNRRGGVHARRIRL
jgi:uncharacterized protein (DUF58 family)